MNSRVLDIKMPALFVSHGTPMLAIDAINGKYYKQWAGLIPEPKAILVFSAHWQSEQLTMGEIKTHDHLIYDFFGFPETLYRLQYNAPGSAWLAEEVQNVLGNKVALKKSNRGLDHGVWVPFLHMWPQANVPILQLSMPVNISNKALFELGKRLAPLREKDVLIVGSGMVTHNLQHWNSGNQGELVAWAAAFDQWLKEILLSHDKAHLLDWQEQAPHAKQNHPTPEHFNPLLIVAGASDMSGVSFPIEGFEAGVFSRRTVQFD